MREKVVHVSRVEPKPVTEGGARGTRIRWLISKEDGAPNFSMRYFEIEPGGHTPRHSHPWEHEIFILEGEGLVEIGDREYEVGPGTAVFIPPDVFHSITNTGTGILKLLCLIPHVG